MRRADNLTTFMCRLSRNLGPSTSWNPLGLSRPVMGLLYLLVIGIRERGVSIGARCRLSLLCSNSSKSKGFSVLLIRPDLPWRPRSVLYNGNNDQPPPCLASVLGMCRTIHLLPFCDFVGRYRVTSTVMWFFPPWRNSPPVGQGLLFVEASQSHSVGLLWTSDEPDTETAT
jgi:hypothetical protein